MSSTGPHNVVEGTEPGGVGSGRLRVIWMSRSPPLGRFLFPQKEEDGLDEYFSQLAPWTGGSNAIWERVRNENSLTPLETCCIRCTGLDLAVCFDAASRGF